MSPPHEGSPDDGVRRISRRRSWCKPLHVADPELPDVLHSAVNPLAAAASVVRFAHSCCADLCRLAVALLLLQPMPDSR